MYMCVNIYIYTKYTLYINHHPFKIGGRTVNVSYNLDVFQGGGVIIVNFHLFSKYILIANFHLKSVGSPSFSRNVRKNLGGPSNVSLHF